MNYVLPRFIIMHHGYKGMKDSDCSLSVEETVKKKLEKSECWVVKCSSINKCFEDKKRIEGEDRKSRIKKLK